MSDDKTPTLGPLQGEILPPSQYPSTLRDGGLPFMTEVRNWSERRQLESFVKVHRVRTEMMALVLAQHQLSNAIHRVREEALSQLDNIEPLRERAKLQIQHDLETLRGDAELRRLRLELEKDRILVEHAELKLRLLALQKPDAEPPSQPSAAERLETSLQKISELDAVFRRAADKIVLAAGGEDHLTDHQRAELDQLEMARRIHVENLYASMA
jgi:hypothetical protein